MSMKDPRPSEVAIEASIIRAEYRGQGRKIPNEAWLQATARGNVRDRYSRLARQENFNRQNGWTPNRIQGL